MNYKRKEKHYSNNYFSSVLIFFIKDHVFSDIISILKKIEKLFFQKPDFCHDNYLRLPTIFKNIV